MSPDNIYCSAREAGYSWYCVGGKEGADRYKGFAKGEAAKELIVCKSVEKYRHLTSSAHDLFALFKEQHCILLF